MKKGDIIELKSLAAPPVGVIATVGAAYCLLEQPINGKVNWPVCKAMLSKSDLLKRIQAFDPKNCYLDSAKSAKSQIEGITLDSIKCKSMAAAGMYSWCVEKIAEVESTGGKQREEQTPAK